jgi:hypothetical protein
MSDKKQWPGSTNITGARYSHTQMSLTITFKTKRTYRYDNVPLPIWEEMKLANSAGQYLNNYIQNIYFATEVPYEKI